MPIAIEQNTRKEGFMNSTNTYTLQKRLTTDKNETDITLDKFYSRVRDGAVKSHYDAIQKLDNKTRGHYKAKHLGGIITSQADEITGRVHSGLFQIDIDVNEKWTEEDCKNYKDEMRTHSNVALAFLSVSGGLKIFVRTNLTGLKISKEEHRKAYQEIIEYFGIRNEDNCGNQIGRFCYYSFDRECYYNGNAVPLNIDLESIRATIRHENKIIKSDNISCDSASIKEVLKAFDLIGSNEHECVVMNLTTALAKIIGIDSFIVIKNKFGKKSSVTDTKIERWISECNKHEMNENIIFSVARKYGYVAKLHGQLLSKTSRESTYSHNDRVDITTAERQTKQAIQDFFSGDNNTFLNITAGVGKSHLMIAACCDNTNKNIDILVKSHEMARQIVEDFVKFRGVVWTADSVNHIYGRTSEEANCKNKEINPNTTDQHSKICKACDLANDCIYANQFSNKAKIRIYTHNHLYQQSSALDRREKQVLIVDEDICNLMAKNTHSTNNNIPKIVNQLKQGNTLASLLLKDEYFDLLMRLKEEQGLNNTAIKILANYARTLLKDNTARFNYSYEIAGNSLIIHAKNNIHKKYDKAKMLFLDATGNKAIAEKVLGVEMDFINIKCKKSRDVKTTQFAQNNYSKSYIAEHTEQVISDIKNAVNNSNAENIGIITYQNINGTNNFYKKIATEIGAKECGYFGNLRGSNKFVNCDLLIILGRAHSGDGCIDMYKNLNPEEVNLDQFIGSDVVNGYENSFFRYEDDEVQNLKDFLDKSETIQAIERSRSVRGGNKELWYFSQEIIDFEFDNLVIDDGDLSGKVLEFIENNGFVIARKTHLEKAIGVDITKHEFIKIENSLVDSRKEVTFKNASNKIRTVSVFSNGDVVTVADLRPHYKGKIFTADV